MSDDPEMAVAAEGEITTYPEMNAKIVRLLRLSYGVVGLYAAARIEELEAALVAAERERDEWKRKWDKTEEHVAAEWRAVERVVEAARNLRNPTSRLYSTGVREVDYGHDGGDLQSALNALAVLRGKTAALQPWEEKPS